MVQSPNVVAQGVATRVGTRGGGRAGLIRKEDAQKFLTES